MQLNFHRIAYEALDVCNATSMDRIEAAVVLAQTTPGMRAIDIGCANASVSIRMAERFGLKVEAVELDESMADLAQVRIAASAMAGQITLHRERSDAVLPRSTPFDLILALGTTEPVGAGVRDPEAMLSGLAPYIASGGHLLWGDLVWTSEPPTPLRQIVELQNRYTSDEGWHEAARSAGLRVRFSQVSSAEDWDHYTQAMLTPVQHWIHTHPDHPDALAVAERARQLGMMLDFGRGFMSFGLYLLARD
jgi:cyclopropane fatty-acyl-phospholipid synthase-like methyltransferase